MSGSNGEAFRGAQVEATIPLVLAINCFGLFASCLVSFAIVKICGIGSMRPVLPLAVAILATFRWFLARRYRFARSGWKAETATVLVFIGSLLAANAFIDHSFDGRWYHQEAMIQLNEGFDPFRAHLAEDSLPGLWTIAETKARIVSPTLWVNHYPKATEIAAASIYAWTGTIESAKAFNFVLFAGAGFLLAFAFGRKGGERDRVRWILPAALLANPVVLSQLWTNYNDGQIYLLLVASAGFLALHRRDGNQAWLLCAGAPLLALTGIKFTGLVYACLAAGTCATSHFLLRGFRPALSTAAFLGAPIALGVLFAGFNPYVRNTLEHGHPFYPIMGKDKVEIMSGNMPKEFDSEGRIRKFAQTTFASSDGDFHIVDGVVPAKIPFSVRLAEFPAAAKYDCHVGGFGPFFGGILILASVVYSVSWFRRLRFGGTAEAGWEFALWATIASCLVNPELWWARYVPQLWAVPLLLFSCAGDVFRHNRTLGRIASGLALGSSGVVLAFVVVAQVKSAIIIERDLLYISRSNATVRVYLGQWTGDRLKYRERSIPVEYVERSASIHGRYQDTLFNGGIVDHDDPQLESLFRSKGIDRTLRSRLLANLARRRLVFL